MSHAKKIDSRNRPIYWNAINVLKGALVLVLLVVGVKCYRFLNPESISSFVSGYGAIAPVVFILLCGIRPILFFIPTMGLAVVAGVLFGPVWGTIYVAIGGMFSTAVGFYFARWYGMGLMRRLSDIDERVGKIDNWAKEHGRNAILSMRFFNMPWDVVSYWAGFSNMRFKDFYIASMIPLVPISFLYTYFGSKIFTPKSWGFIVSLSIMFTLGAIPFIMHRLKNRSKPIKSW